MFRKLKDNTLGAVDLGVVLMIFYSGVKDHIKQERDCLRRVDGNGVYYLPNPG